MPQSCLALGGLSQHVRHRLAAGLPSYEQDDGYEAIERIVAEAM